MVLQFHCIDYVYWLRGHSQACDTLARHNGYRGE